MLFGLATGGLQHLLTGGKELSDPRRTTEAAHCVSYQFSRQTSWPTRPPGSNVVLMSV